MLHSEFKLNEPNRRRADERNRNQQQDSKYEILTGRILQALLFFLALGCFVTGFVIASQLNKIRMVSHALHLFYWQFKAVSLFSAVLGVVAFVWCLLDYFLINPRFEKRKNLERATRSQRSNRLRVPEDTSTSLRQRVSQERRKEDSDTQQGHPTAPVQNLQGIRTFRLDQDHQKSVSHM